MKSEGMRAPLRDLGRNLEILREMRDSLVREGAEREIHEATRERWDTFGRVAESIVEACSERDLEKLASSVRDMKNKLRRPSVRRDLERLESKEGDDKPDGQCRCDECDKVIDGSNAPCIDGALCTACALKKRVGSEKGKKSQPGQLSQKEKGSMGGADQKPSEDEAETSSGSQNEVASLRVRKY